MSEVVDMLSLDMTVVKCQAIYCVLRTIDFLLVLNVHRHPEKFGCVEKIISKCFLMSFR